MLAVLGAMKEEIATLRKQMTVEEARAQGGGLIYKGKYRDKDMLLVQTGIGKMRAERAAEAVLSHYSLEAMVSLGFAGALDKELKVGDVVLCSTLYFAKDGDLEAENPCHSDTILMTKAAAVANAHSLRLLQGYGVTVSRVLAEPTQKKAMGRSSLTKTVDMESYWVARAAQAKGVPFLAVRAISDTIEEGLPPFERFITHSGDWQKGTAALYFLAHPWQLVKLLRLRRNIRQAGKSLDFFMDSFIAEL